MRRPLTAVVVVSGILAAALAASGPPAAAYQGAPWFRPGLPYSANFPDPSVVLDGSTYVAFGTSTGGAYLPVMTSPDLLTWTARPAYEQPECIGADFPDPFYNDAFPCPPSWGFDRAAPGRLVKEIWAPGAIHIGERWIVFYSMREHAGPDRFCIGRAVSEDGPLGPYVDELAAPLQCDADPAGSIDPQPFVDDDGTPYLVWKSEGVVGGTPPRIWARPLTADGLAFVPGSSQVELVRNTPGSWEGNLIENPSMVRSGGRLLLFFSANEWRSADYAIGYAECQTPLGPCTKSAQNPIHSQGRGENGPGGPTAFVDPAGHVRIAYHYWNPPYSSYPADPGCDGPDPATGVPLCASQGQRRLAIGEVELLSTGIRWPGLPVVARDHGDACPPGRVPRSAFTDVTATDVHRPAIECLAWWAVASGTTATQYGSTEVVSRAQMATFLARLLVRSGGRLPTSAPDAFRDDDGLAHEDNINALAAMGVITGQAPGSFGPTAPVTREQMATFLVRVANARVGGRLPSPSDRFVDDAGSVHERNINAAAEAGFTGGRADGTFGPHSTVTRGQMASFLGRVLDLLVEITHAPLPT